MNDGSPLRADGERRTARVAGLYAVTPDLDDTDLLLALVAAALDGGATVVQYRHKTADDGLRLAQARALARLCAARGRAFIVNDHVDVALAIDGAGLHVGADDFHDLAGLRRQLGAGRILGVSCYRSPDRARDAVAAGADYVAFGSIFASGTKVHAPVAGHALFAQGTELGVPRVGIGGITADNIDALVAAGADAAAVIGDLFGSHDPVVVRSRARALASAFARSTPSSTDPSMTTTSRNDELFARASRTTPGGVNSPVRAFRQVGGVPRFVERAEGPYFWDADGRRYIDYIGSWGPAILGHAHAGVVRAVQEAATRGLSFGAPTEGEIEMAELLVRLVPSMEQVRLVSSGTEAAMSAIRLARGATGRPKIIKFDGCYHGHADSLLVKAGSGLLTFNTPSSAGVPASMTEHTLVLDYNDAGQLEAAFAAHPDAIACVIVEPVAGNMNLVRATPEFVAAMRALCSRHGALLVFDEVMSGFRVALGGAQSLYDVSPDITVLGKVIGGGLPVAAFGGSRDVMRNLSPEGAVYQAGTLSGNPVAVAAGLATLKAVSQPGFYETLGTATRQLADGLGAAARAAGVELRTDAVGGMFGFYFTGVLPQRVGDVTASDIERFKRFFHAMLDRGVYFAPSAYEAGFVSATHDAAVIDETLRHAREAFGTLG